MNLSSDLVSEFAKVMNDGKNRRNETTIYGTISIVNDASYVKLDGSDELTPVVSTVVVNDGDRVIVTLKQHQAVVTNNLTDPSMGLRVYEDGAAGLRTTIEETAKGIRKEISDEVNGLNTVIEEQAGQITSLVTSSDAFSEFKQTVEGFEFMDKGGTVKISGGSLDLTGSITFSDFDPDAQNKLNSVGDNVEAAEKAKNDAEAAKKAVDEAKEAVDKAKEAADKAKEDAEQAKKDASTSASDAATYADSAYWDALAAYDDAKAAAASAQAISDLTTVDKGVTYLNGRMIYSGSIYADAIRLGGELTIFNSLWSGNTVGGYIGYTEGFNSNKGIGVWHSEAGPQCVCTNQAARLSYGTNSQVICGSNSVYLDGTTIVLQYQGNDQVVLDYQSLRPAAAGDAYLGTSACPWISVWAQTGTIQPSDRNKKNSIENLPEKYITLFDNLKPSRYKLNSGTSDRYHIGYIAQEVEEAMEAAGIDSQEFAGLVKDVDADGNEIYMLRYDEFESIYDLKIKQLEARYEAKINDLEARLAKLEERLGYNEEGG